MFSYSLGSAVLRVVLFSALEMKSPLVVDFLCALPSCARSVQVEAECENNKRNSAVRGVKDAFVCYT